MYGWCMDDHGCVYCVDSVDVQFLATSGNDQTYFVGFNGCHNAGELLSVVNFRGKSTDVSTKEKTFVAYRREWVKLCNSSSTARKSAECPFPWKKKSDEAKKMYKTQAGSQKNDPLFQRRACPILASLKHLLLTKSLRCWFTFAGYLANLYRAKKNRLDNGYCVFPPCATKKTAHLVTYLTKVYPGIQINMSASAFPVPHTWLSLSPTPVDCGPAVAMA